MFPEIKEIPCESKKDCFALINWIIAYIRDHSFLLVSDMYAHLELDPIPKEAYHYCWMSANDFALHKAESSYFVATKNPIEIIE